MGFIPGLYVEKGGALWYNQKINDHSTFRGNGGTGRAAAGRTRAGAAEDRSLQTSSLFHKSLRAQAITKIGAYETPYRLLNLPAKMVQ